MAISIVVREKLHGQKDVMKKMKKKKKNRIFWHFHHFLQ